MKRKYALQLGVLLLLGMGVLFSMVTFGQPDLRQKRELLELSVLIREADSTGWTAARQGMEQAATDLEAELRFLTLRSPNDVADQRDLLRREVEGGADGIILVPADPVALAEDVRQASAQAAVVTMESDMTMCGAVAYISADNVEMGEALAQAALNGVPAGGRVILLDSASGSTGILERLSQAARTLAEAGRMVAICRPSKGQSLGEALEIALEESANAVIAFEPSALEQTALLLQTMENAPLVYGTGATGTIVSCLERGNIVAIAAQNEFAAGYLAVEAAAGAARSIPFPGIGPMTFSMIRQENMYAAGNQKLLFPVTR